MTAIEPFAPESLLIASVVIIPPPALSVITSVPEFVIDLGKTETAIYGFEVSTLGGGSAGVYAPTEITVYVSDGERLVCLTNVD